MSSGLDLAAAAQDLCQKHGFEYHGPLGKGAFKSAYLAKAQTVFFALKIAVAAGGAERLARETKALQGCAHPAIAQSFGAAPFEYGGTQLWVVYEEFLAGGTLEAALKNGPLRPEKTKTIALTLAGALEHLHERKLVHRDIKPANIMFRGDAPVLTDFGIVRMLDQPTLTHAFMQMGPGTPAYAAPEQLNNAKELIDWRTDQFGLGIVVAECMLGHHPFLIQGKTVHEAILNVASWQDVPEVNAQRLRQLGFSCLLPALKPWPVDRYRKPAAFIASLNTI